MAKSKLVKIYEDKKTGSYFIRSTINKGGRFILRDERYGKAIGKNVSDEELGRAVREIFKYCE